MLIVSPTANKEKIINARWQIMFLNHPNSGGSPYIAARVSEATDLLEGQAKNWSKCMINLKSLLVFVWVNTSFCNKMPRSTKKLIMIVIAIMVIFIKFHYNSLSYKLKIISTLYQKLLITKNMTLKSDKKKKFDKQFKVTVINKCCSLLSSVKLKSLRPGAE